MKNLKQITVETELPIEALTEITKQIRGSVNDASTESWSDAALTLSWSVGPSGGSIKGWITYYDGRKIHITGTESSKTGTAAGAAALPWIRVLDWDQMPESGEFDLSGFGLLGATIHLRENGQYITNPSGIASTSAAGWDFKMKGKCSYKKS